MECSEMIVSLSPGEAWKVVEQAVVNGSVTGKLIDSYYRANGNVEVIVLVLEKYYARTSNRGSLTVTIDNFDGTTKVHAAASGTAQGMLIRFDWGAGDNFVNSVMKSLENYRVN